MIAKAKRIYFDTTRLDFRHVRVAVGLQFRSCDYDLSEVFLLIFTIYQKIDYWM